MLTLTVTISCGGGGDSGPTGGGTTIVAADFTPTELNPGANTVSALGSSSSNIVTLSVMVTGTAGVYGASFDLVYDPDVVEFAGYSPGNLLENGGQQVTAQIDDSFGPGLPVGNVLGTDIDHVGPALVVEMIEGHLRSSRKTH